ncbi:MAG: bifunctional 2-polyprenyl-6-hydroxyphenol methylase/3-demethylubiquinol 3-O-methyltransferase UbiG [Pseudomonadota bacterium]
MRNDLTIYDQTAEQWWSDDIRWVRTLKNMVPARMKWFDQFVTWEGTAVLDLGCAGGFMAEALDDRGARVTGIDPAEDAIAAARRHADGRDIRYDVGVGEALPYEDAAFDIVVCVDVLEHVADLDAVLAECARVLKPGGWFLYDTINRNLLASFAVVTVAEDILRLLPKGAHDPSMFIRPADLVRRLDGAGFEVRAQAGLGPTGVNRRGDITFGRVPVKAVQYMGAAQKS